MYFSLGIQLCPKLSFRQICQPTQPRNFKPIKIWGKKAGPEVHELWSDIFFLFKTKKKKFCRVLKKIRGFSRIFKKFLNLLNTFFKTFINQKPSLWSRDVPQKIWARSVQPFWRLLNTNRQTNRQTPRQDKFIYRLLSH